MDRQARVWSAAGQNEWSAPACDSQGMEEEAAGRRPERAADGWAARQLGCSEVWPAVVLGTSRLPSRELQTMDAEITNPENVGRYQVVTVLCCSTNKVQYTPKPRAGIPLTRQSGRPTEWKRVAQRTAPEPARRDLPERGPGLTRLRGALAWANGSVTSWKPLSSGFRRDRAGGVPSCRRAALEPGDLRGTLHRAGTLSAH